MGVIKIFSGPPKSFDFNNDDLVIDNVSGDIYYKDWKGRIQKIIKSKDEKASLSIGTIEAAKQLSVKGNITASGNISSSAAVIANLFKVNNIITHHLTASGNISASGTIIANNFQSTDSGGVSREGIDFTDNIFIDGNVTSSGNISASGEFFAATGSFDIIEGGVF